uniref:Uncharacterized protein n=1 Tax=viral metagenome TaxID=1070528 RepID=A0A6M3IXJ1_9ZZZZ
MDPKITEGLQMILQLEDINEIKKIAQGLLGTQQPAEESFESRLGKTMEG